jgi:uncharacterized membrane protein
LGGGVSGTDFKKFNHLISYRAHFAQSSMLNKKKVWLSALAAVVITFIVAKGDRVTAAIGSLTATMGALALNQWSMIIGIACTLLTFVITNVVNIVYKRKALAILEKNTQSSNSATAFFTEEDS